MTKMRILSLQPYYGGSHRAFMEGWERHSQFEWTILSLPPRHWKWRMRHSAIEFARQIGEQWSDQTFDAVVCTDFLNLAELKGLVASSIHDLPTVAYFHENQLAYPSQFSDPRDLHFGLTNLTTCLAADQVWFNSRFNQQSFIHGLQTACEQWPDYPPTVAIESIATKSKIQCPGIELPPAGLLSDPLPESSSLVANEGHRGVIHLLWAARWEHDKHPQDLLEVLSLLSRNGVDFCVSVIGQSFREQPPVFAKIRDQFSDRIVHWGFQETREDYWRVLRDADIFVSTAAHEFFGIAAAEAIAAGLYPLLPNRLAYPELIGSVGGQIQSIEYLYTGGAETLATRIAQLSNELQSPACQTSLARLRRQVIAKFSWHNRAAQLDNALQILVDSRRVGGIPQVCDR